MDDLIDGSNVKVALGHSLLNTLDALDNQNINGINKLKGKIKKEIDFLLQFQSKGALKKEHIVGSNLNHFEALVSYLINAKDCTDVLKVFHFSPDQNVQYTKRLDVDVVSENKKRWTKVIARNPKSLSLISKGEGGFGQKSIVDHAVDYLKCAEQNTYRYRAPYVEFFFGSGIDSELVSLLLGTGVYVSGKLLNEEGVPFEKNIFACPNNVPEEDVHSPDSGQMMKLNLDVTTMISYVSALTNGHEKYPVRGKMLQEQAAMERERPLKPVLEKIFDGNELYACTSAVQSFSSLVDIMGGKGEKQRTKELLGRLNVVDDAKVWWGEGPGKKRSAVVFATGASLKAVTVTANKSFVNSSAMQGIHFEVIIHEPRGLSESKEIIQGFEEKESN